MPNQTLSTDVRGVLERSEIIENKLVLPPGQLDRKLYESVNKALTNAGGKWDRFAKAHIFSGDPRQQLGLVLETGVSIDVAGNHKKQYQSFYTPPDLADKVAELADVSGHRVLEPSAGEGALVTACLKAGATQIDCIDIREECRPALIGKGRVVTIGDFLKTEPCGLFSRIVMNPPFTKGQDRKHVLHALKWLESGGVLVAIVCGGRDAEWAAALSHFIYEALPVPKGAFKSSGTQIATAIIRVRSLS